MCICDVFGSKLAKPTDTGASRREPPKRLPYATAPHVEF
ncbi:uncharacterized protein HfgLR_25320 (plasmid) [Haloferax gibbonsii]|uniref:Uncharacterized protein n=1 Tax=Haloferax gibbonsii TaxID=35746 RepID=A0A871BMA7_HALGI|nr:uncharacterized protein HfgLR_25320 [Haloferax gibbonsii]